MAPAWIVAGRAAVQGSVGSLAAFWHNLSLREVSGSCGDLGTFIPLTVRLNWKRYSRRELLRGFGEAEGGCLYLRETLAADI